MEVDPSSKGTGSTQDQAKEIKYTTIVTTQSKRKHTTISTHNSKITQTYIDVMVLNQEKQAIVVDIDIAVSFEGNLDTSK